jgi:hypothetical protein
MIYPSFGRATKNQREPGIAVHQKPGKSAHALHRRIAWTAKALA